ncbi:hypothetical protein ACPPVS_16140 [Cellulomonas sp. McL0617]|uniref:hypothetical protein n=1 Tax=Cellulomonas sp. McL0617 TaxID=3415675 RepID=UPI003CECAC74
MSRRLVSSSVAALAAVVLWVLSGTMSHAWRAVGGLAPFVPFTSGALQLVRSETTAWLVGVVVLAVVVGVLVVPVTQDRTGGWPVVLLAVWFASAAGAGLAALAAVETSTHLGATRPGDLIGTVTAGAYWGVVWGWAVGLAVVRVQRRPLRTVAPVTERAARLAAATAALVGGLGWLVVGGLRSWADGSVDLTDQAAVAGHQDASPWIATLLPVPAGWWARLVTGDTPRLWLGAVVVALVQGVLVYVAARTVHRALGRTAFTFAVWFATIAAAVVATGAMYVGAGTELYPGTSVVSSLMLVGGQLGVQYGWFDALLALLVLVAVDGRTRALHEVDVDAPAAA